MCFQNKRPPSTKDLIQKLRWELYEVKELVLASAADNAAAIATVTTQLGKAKAEIVSKIEALQTAADQGQDLSGPLNDLALAAQGLDDVVPDPAPEPEAPVEEPEV